jgi:hypothetical protein
MSTNEESMEPRGRTTGAGMGPAGGAEMDPEQPDLHSLDPEEQRARMGLAEPGTAMGQPPAEGMPSEDEIARGEEAAKRGESP